MIKPLSIGMILLLGTSTLASSRVIRDNRLSDLGVSPVLGRGYSVATNTYQSTCMGEVENKSPYDLKYRFIEIERNWERSYKTLFESKNSFRYLFLKGNVKVFSEVSGNDTLSLYFC